MISRPVVRLLACVMMIASAAVASPTLNGAYHGKLGVLQFDTEQDGRVSGHLARAGMCDFETDRRVIEGLFEGEVLVGSVYLCQVGQACTEKSYPFLAFYNPKDGTLSGDVKLEPGCASPALNGKRLLLERGEPNDGKPLPPKKKNGNHRNSELAQRAFDNGRKAIASQDYQKARDEFLKAISYDEKNYLPYFGLGVAEINLGHTQAALEAYRRSAELNPDYPDNYYDMACAYARINDKKNAIANLTKAVKLGFSDSATMLGDRDLGNLLGSDPDFQQLVAKAKDQEQKQHHARGPGKGGR